MTTTEKLLNLLLKSCDLGAEDVAPAIEDPAYRRADLAVERRERDPELFDGSVPPGLA